MSDVTITSVSAKRLLELLEKSPDSLELLQKLMRYFKEKIEMHQILIKLEGEHFDGVISGDFAKGLVAIQENFYRYCAYVLYGKDDIKLLGKEKAKYTLYFSINRGCTETIAKISQSIEMFIDRALKKK